MNRLLAACPVLLLIAAAGSGLPILPGKWQTIVTLTDLKMPGAPPGLGAAIRARPTKITACLTPAQAANGPRAVLQGSKGKCRYTRFDVAGGRFNAVMQCAFGSGTMTTTSTGSYTATTMDVVGSATMKTPSGITTTKSRLVGRRIGPC